MRIYFLYICSKVRFLKNITQQIIIISGWKRQKSDEYPMLLSYIERNRYRSAEITAHIIYAWAFGSIILRQVTESAKRILIGNICKILPRKRKGK